MQERSRARDTRERRRSQFAKAWTNAKTARVSVTSYFFGAPQPAAATATPAEIALAATSATADAPPFVPQPVPPQPKSPTPVFGEGTKNGVPPPPPRRVHDEAEWRAKNGLPPASAVVPAGATPQTEQGGGGAVAASAAAAKPCATPGGEAGVVTVAPQIGKRQNSIRIQSVKLDVDE